MRGIDNKGNVAVAISCLKSLDISGFRGLRVENHCLEFTDFLLRGNMSKQALTFTTDDLDIGA